MQAPIDNANIPAALAHAAQQWPERGVHFYDDAGIKNFITYPQLLATASRVADRLEEMGGAPGDRLLMAIPGDLNFISVFIGALMARRLPVPLSATREGVPFSQSIESISRIGQRLGANWLILPPDLDSAAVALAESEDQFEHIAPVDWLLKASKHPQDESQQRWADIQHNDVAYIQCTSGATGPLKGVMLTHGNILSNVTDIGNHLKVQPDDVGVSWLPLAGDMGLVGVLLFSLCWGLPLVLIDPSRFLKVPQEWLWAIHNHQGTLSPASDFGFHYCTRRARRSDLEGLDLSSWRVAMNGSEVVQAIHMSTFERRFSKHGMRQNIIVPVYGLAEATVAVTFGALDNPLKLDHIDRNKLELHGVAATSPPDAHNAVGITSVGTPLPSVNLELRDMQGKPVGERTVGELFVQGPSVSVGYGHDDQLGLDADGWITTGDLGYIADGDLYVLGRRSEAINLGSRTVHPATLETVLGGIDGVRPGAVAVFGVHTAAAAAAKHDAISRLAQQLPNQSASSQSLEHGPELLIVAAETSEGIDTERLREIILHAVERLLGTPPHDIRILPPRTLPRSQSGRIRHFKCRALYLDARLEPRKPRQQTINALTERARGVFAQLGKGIRGIFGNTKS